MTNNLKNLLILSIAISIGIACALPDILGRLEFKDRYEPFTHSFSSEAQYDETCWYGPGASYFKQTLHLPFEADIYEYLGKPNMKYLLPIMIDGGIGYIFKDLRLGRLIIHLIFPALCFLLAFQLCRKLSVNVLISAVTAVIFCTLGFGPRTFLSMGIRNITQAVFLSRVTSPAVTLPFLLLALIWLIDSYTKKSGKAVIFAGIFGGLLYYVYYYYQIAYVVALILLTVFCIFGKKWDKVIRLILIGIIVNLTAIPWYLQYYLTVKNSPYFIHRFISLSPNISCAANCTALIMPVAAYSAVLILAYMLWKPCVSTGCISSNKFGDSGYAPLFSICIASFLLLSIVDPFLVSLVQSWHFIQHIANGFVLLIISSVIGHRFFSNGYIRKILPIVAICTLILILFIKQFNVWQNTKDCFKSEPSERIAEELVKKYTSPMDVVGIKDTYLNSVFNVRLWRPRFYAQYISFGNIELGDNITRYLFINRIFNKSWEEIHRELLSKDNNYQKIEPVDAFSFSKLCELYPGSLDAEFHRIYNSLDKNILKDKKLDYLICIGPGEEKELIAGANSLGVVIDLVNKKDSVSLYKVLK